MAGGERVASNESAAPTLAIPTHKSAGEPHFAPDPAPVPRPYSVSAALAVAVDAITAFDKPLDILAILVERRMALHSELEKIELQIRVIRGTGPDGQRPWCHCRRCGWDWQSYGTELPRACARCHSIGWNIEPVLSNARKPGDAPAKSWKSRQPRRLRPLKGKAAIAAVAAANSAAEPTTLDVPAANTTADLRFQPVNGLPPPPRASAFAPRAIAPPPTEGSLSAQLVEALQVDDVTADAYVPEEDADATAARQD